MVSRGQLFWEFVVSWRLDFKKKFPSLQILAKALAIAALVCTSGCMTLEVEGAGAQTPRSHLGSETLHGSFYQFKWTNWNTEVCPEGRGLRKVELHTNILYMLASTFSLGLYVPQSVDWWCEEPSPGPDGPILNVPE